MTHIYVFIRKKYDLNYTKNIIFRLSHTFDSWYCVLPQASQFCTSP